MYDPKKEGRAFRKIGKKIYIYIPYCKINLASFVSITMQVRRSEWQAHLLHLHLETFKSHN